MRMRIDRYGFCRHREGTTCEHCDTALHTLAMMREGVRAAQQELTDTVRELAEQRDRSFASLAAAAGMSRSTVHGLVDDSYRKRRNAS